MADRKLQLVFSKPVKGREAEFVEWYDNVHLPEILAMPGIVSAQRFDLVDAEITRSPQFPPPTHRHLAIYEMEGDVDATMMGIYEAVMAGDIHMSEALDLSVSVMTFWSPAGPKLTK